MIVRFTVTLKNSWRLTSATVKNLRKIIKIYSLAAWFSRPEPVSGTSKWDIYLWELSAGIPKWANNFGSEKIVSSIFFFIYLSEIKFLGSTLLRAKILSKMFEKSHHNSFEISWKFSFAEFVPKLFNILNHFPKICPNFFLNSTKMFLNISFSKFSPHLYSVPNVDYTLCANYRKKGAYTTSEWCAGHDSSYSPCLWNSFFTFCILSLISQLSSFLTKRQRNFLCSVRSLSKFRLLWIVYNDKFTIIYGSSFFHRIFGNFFFCNGSCIMYSWHKRVPYFLEISIFPGESWLQALLATGHNCRIASIMH